jgi:NAD(P)-dependent dehydrogenase (short-subunit alcohol dehydrogenase family)
VSATPVAAVTGAGAGFGAALVERCHAAGYAVAVLDLDGVAAERTAMAIAEQGGTAKAWPVDVADRSALDRTADEVRSSFGRCDLLFANAGVQQFGALENLSAQDWQWLLSVNLLGTVNTVCTFLPLMRATDGNRHVVLTSSDSVLAPSGRLGGYIVTKAGVRAFGDVLATELTDDGIGVTVVFPSGMITDILGNSAASRPATLGPVVLRDNDVAYVSAHAAPKPGDVLMPADAAAGLLEQVLENQRYIVTHGSSRSAFEARVGELRDAYERMARLRQQEGPNT